MEKEDCPGNGCQGKLEKKISSHTDMHHTEYNKNTITEQWKCDTCGVIFVRSYRWQLLEERR